MWRICSIDCLSLLEIIYHKNTISIPKKRGHNFSSLQNSLCLFWLGWARLLPLFRLLFGSWGEPMDPYFIHGHKTQQKLVMIGLKRVQISMWHILSCLLLINCQKSGYPRGWVLISRSFVRMEWTLSWEIPTGNSISYVSLYNSSVTHNHIMDFSDYFRSCHSDRPSRMGVIL